MPRRQFALLACLLMIAWAPSVALADGVAPADAAVDDDAEGPLVSASVHGNATCNRQPLDLIVGVLDPRCVAVSGTGDARGDYTAALLGGDATAHCHAIALEGRASGGDYSDCVALSRSGDATGGNAITLHGDATGRHTAISLLGDANACHPYIVTCLAASGAGNASAGAALSLLGAAHGSWLATSGTGDAACAIDLCLATSATGDARSSHVAASATGNATAGTVAVSVLGACGATDAHRRPCREAATGTPDKPLHAPILIDGDAGPTGFILRRDAATGAPVYRPGSGVVSGNGTVQDPYVIEGWTASAIALRDTTAHALIRHNALRGPMDAGAGACAGGAPGTARVALTRASNVTVRSNLILGGGCGVAAEDSRHVTITDNVVAFQGQDGVNLAGAENARVAGNVISHALSGVTVGTLLSYASPNHPGRGVVVEGNTVHNTTFTGIVLFGDDSVVRGNGLRDVPAGYSVHVHGADNLVEANRMRRTGTLLVDGVGAVVRANDLAEPKRSLSFLSVLGSDHLVEDNDVQGVADGVTVRLFQTDDTAFTGNRVTGAVMARGAFQGHTMNLSITHNVVDPGAIALDYGFAGCVVAHNAVANATRDDWPAHGSGIHVDGNYRDTSSACRVHDNTIRSTHSNGVQLIGAPAAHVARNTISESGTDGVWVYRSDGAQVADNHVTGSGGSGILTWYGEGLNVSGNDVRENEGVGVSIRRTLHSRLMGNVVAANGGHALDLFGAHNLTLRANAITDGALQVTGFNPTHFIHDIDASTTVNGQPAYYARGVTNATVPSGAGAVILSEARNVTVAGLTGDDVSVVVAYSSNVTVTNATLQASGSGVGVGVVGSRDVHVTDVTVDGYFYGVVSRASENVTLAGNDVGNATGSVVAEGNTGLLLEANRFHGSLIDVLSTGQPQWVARDNAFASGVVLNDLLDPDAPRPTLMNNTVGGAPLVFATDVEEVTVDGAAGQVILANVTRATIANATMARPAIGVLAIDVDELTLRNVDLGEAAISGLYGRSGKQWVLDGVRAATGGAAFWSRAVLISLVDDVRVERGHFEAAETLISTSVSVSNFENLRVANTTIAGATGTWSSYGFLASAGANLTMRHSTITGAGIGAYVAYNVETARLEANNVTGNDVGVFVNHYDDSATAGVTLRDNNIWNNSDAGVVGDTERHVDARHNWWGCPGGPDDGACDGVEGDVAYDPWRATPNADAGMAG